MCNAMRRLFSFSVLGKTETQQGKLDNRFITSFTHSSPLRPNACTYFPVRNDGDVIIKVLQKHSINIMHYPRRKLTKSCDKSCTQHQTSCR